MRGSACGVCAAALWNSTIEPGFTLSSTRRQIASTPGFFQSRLSTSHWIVVKPASRIAPTTVSL